MRLTVCLLYSTIQDKQQTLPNISQQPQERYHRRDKCYPSQDIHHVQDRSVPEEKSTRLPLIDMVENCSTFTEECTDDELVEEIILEMVE